MPRNVTFASHPIVASLGFLPFLILYPLADAVTIALVAQLCVADSRSLTGALRSLRPVWVRILAFQWLALTMYLILFTTGVGMFAIIEPILGAEALEALVFTAVLIVIVASFALALYFFVSWSLATITLIAEQPPRWSALGRSRSLIRGVWWKTAFMLTGVYVFSFLSYRLVRFFWVGIPTFGSWIASEALAVIGTYISVLFVIYYFDRRCRTEDFDLRLLAEQIRAAIPSMQVVEQSA